MNPDPAFPQSPAPPRGWVASVAAIVLLALALPGAPPAPAMRAAPARPAEGAAPASPGTVRVTLTPAEPPGGPVSIAVRVDDGLTEFRATLPASLDVPPGRDVVLTVDAPGRARFTRRGRFDADTALRVALPPGARLAGVVVDDRGEPVAGAEIRVDREDVEDLPPWLARSDEAGRFEIDTLHAGSHALRVGARGHGAVARPGVEPGDPQLRLVLPRVGSIAGRVVGEDGAPRAEATVVVAGSGIWPARQVATDADGRFVFSAVPPGTYEARAHAAQLVAEPRRGIEVEPDTRAFLTFVLRPGAVLVGIVTDSDTEEGIAGAEITVSSESLDVAPRAATSDPDGRFRVAGLRRTPHRVSVWADGYVPVTALPHDPGEPLAIALTPGGTLSGIVVDADRRPIEGASLEVIGEATDQQPVALDSARGFRGAVFASQLEVGTTMRLEVTEGDVPPIPVAPLPATEGALTLPPVAAESRLAAAHVSGPDGRFRIEGIPPGHVQVVARHLGFASATTARLFVGAGASREGLELVLAPAGRLTGRVVDEREVGVEGVLVEVFGDREPHPRVAFTDERGELIVESVVGELTVTARPNGRPAVRQRATVAPGGEARVLLALEGELHRLRGRTVDARGFPVAAVQVSITALRASAPHRMTLFSARDGTFVAEGLPAGPWRLEATSAGYAPATLDVFGTADEAQVPLARGARVHGTVVDDYSGAGVAAMVRAVRDDLPPERLEVLASPDGTFEVPRARAAAWVLTVEAEGYLPATRTVEVIDRGRGPDDVEVEPVRLTPGGRVEGTVVDALGHVVARATVRVGARRAVTDARGEFSVGGLPAGSAEVVASHPAAGQSRPEPVRVLAGRETPGVVLHLPERLDPSRASALEGRRRGVAVEVSWSGDHARVRAVVPDSHAARSGLRPGDALLAIDGEAPSDVEDARRLLRGAPNVGAVIHLRRGAREATLHVPREVWLPEE